jgi:hypothetical protein
VRVDPLRQNGGNDKFGCVEVDVNAHGQTPAPRPCVKGGYSGGGSYSQKVIGVAVMSENVTG